MADGQVLLQKRKSVLDIIKLFLKKEVHAMYPFYD